MLSLRYEDLIVNTKNNLERIFDYALNHGFIYSDGRDEAVKTLAEAIDPQKSPTFRSGQLGEWKQHFAPAHLELFKEVSGDLLIRLGYEENQNW